MRESAASSMMSGNCAAAAAALLMHLDRYKVLGGRQLSPPDVSLPTRFAHFVPRWENDDRHRTRFSIAFVLVRVFSSRATPGTLGGATTSAGVGMHQNYVLFVGLVLTKLTLDATCCQCRSDVLKVTHMEDMKFSEGGAVVVLELIIGSISN